MRGAISREAAIQVLREAYGLSDAADGINDLPDVAANLMTAAEDLCVALVRRGFGLTSDRALPGEYDTLQNAISDFKAATK